MKLRKINNLEVNKKIIDLPDGVFGYQSAFSIHFEGMKISKRNLTDTERRFYFEIRKYNSEDIKLVGFISNEAQLSFSKNKNFTNVDTIVFPFPYKQFSNKLEIPLYDKKIKIEYRTVEDNIGANITILEISRLDEDVNNVSKVTGELVENKDNIGANITILEISRLDEDVNNVSKVTGELVENDKKEKSFFKKIIEHQVYSLIIVALFVYLFYQITNINLVDYIPK